MDVTLRQVDIDFSRTLREWDGFGVNYVEAAQTRDYESTPQDYGGFSLLSEADRQEILDLIFGEDGLKPALVKMFLDPFHQPAPNDSYSLDPDVLDMAAYDHRTTTQWMRYFVREGLERTRAWGSNLEIITTLYGPPAWMTKQGFVRGRDLDPKYKTEVAKYLISWAKFLREEEGFPVRYLSLHNEGEDWERWPADGSTADRPSHDYNMYWPPHQVADFLSFMPSMLRTHGLEDVGVTPGETTNWFRFSAWGYADAITETPAAVGNIGLITSHGFRGSPDVRSRWFGDWRSRGTDQIRAHRPGLPSWVTSTSWGTMDVEFVNEIRHNIYGAKVNGIIPWATIQVAEGWIGGDPNPGTAFRVEPDGTYAVLPGYYMLKQVSRAGQPGMAVARAFSNDTLIGVIAFAGNGTEHSNAFVIYNLAPDTRTVPITIAGNTSHSFAAYRTSESGEEQYRPLGGCDVRDGTLRYEAPGGTVTTFFEV